MLRVCMVLLVALFLGGCSSRGSEFVGAWENTKNPKESFEITRNGEAFLIVRTKRNAFNGQAMGEEKIPAVLKDGLLHVQVGLGGAALAYVEASDTLTGNSFFGSMEFKRRD
jgi:hypothetical protein